MGSCKENPVRIKINADKCCVRMRVLENEPAKILIDADEDPALMISSDGSGIPSNYGRVSWNGSYLLVE